MITNFWTKKIYFSYNYYYTLYLLLKFTLTDLLTVPSHLPFLDEFAASILADGVVCASQFLQVGTGKLLAELKGLLPFLRQ